MQLVPSGTAMPALRSAVLRARKHLQQHRSAESFDGMSDADAPRTLRSRGRPRIALDVDLIRYLLNRRYSMKEVAVRLEVCLQLGLHLKAMSVVTCLCMAGYTAC